MANITPRKNKDGETVSYRIRVSRGYDAAGNKLKPYELTWRPEPGMTAKQIEKELNRQATIFEEKCKNGLVGDGGKIKFSEYADYVMKLKSESGELKHHTYVRYQELLKRINAGIGHIKLVDIRPAHLNAFYEQLQQNGLRLNQRAQLKDDTDLKLLISKKGYTSREKFAADANVSYATVLKASRNQTIEYSCAEKIAAALGVPVSKIFISVKDNTPLSLKTVREHAMLIGVILHEAEREMLVPYNAAEKAKPPKANKTKAEYFEPEEVTAILEAAEKEPIKWRLLINLLLVTGCRRGEILGLRWSNINWQFSQIYIENCIYYQQDIKIYIDEPKTEKSARYLKLPKPAMDMLSEYRKYYNDLKKNSGSRWIKVIELPNGKGEIQKLDNDFVFVQENKFYGLPMHPDSVTSYMNTFAKRYGLPHINPHKFRHTAASLLYYNGIDSVSISNYLGHAKVSTTTDIYSHVIAESQNRVANTLGDVIYTQRVKRTEDSEKNEENTEKTG